MSGPIHRNAGQPSATSPNATPGALAFTYLELVADALLQRPELLAIARANIVRWLGADAQARARLEEWDAVLARAATDSAGMAALQRILRDQDPQSQRLREFAPFAGVLPRELRRQARDLSTYRH